MIFSKHKVGKVRHELMATDFCVCYPEASFERFAVNRRILADIEMTLDGKLFYVEIDTGEQTLSQVKRRQAKYAGVREFLLYVTASERRLGRLIRSSVLVKDIALFTTLERVQAAPHGEIWTDWYGAKASL